MSRIKTGVFIVLVLASTSIAALPCLFSHGITDNCAQGARYVKGAKSAECGVTPGVDTSERYLFEEKPFLFDYPDAGTGWTKYPKACLSTLGQENEIELLNKNYEHVANEAPEGLVLMGVSRGASAAINFVATKHPEKVRALILEAPYDSAINLARNMLRSIPYGDTLAPYFLAVAFPWHKQTGGIHPENVVNDIPQHMPLLLISSRDDATVPTASVVKLFEKLKESGHTDVYLFVAEHGSHAKILWGPDGEKYQAVVHAFLARYGLPHNHALAQSGKELLDECRGLENVRALVDDECGEEQLSSL